MATQLSQRPLLVLAGAVVLHIILISAQVSTTAGIPVIQVVTFGSFAELQRGTMKSIDSVRSLWTGYVALRDAQAENEALKRELQTLQVQLQQERAEAQRTDRFRQLLELRERAGLKTVASEVIAGPATLEFRDMTIDKGSSDGVAQDMAIISPAGVVGRVILTSPRASRVQMLIDRNAAAGAMIERTRAQGIIVGQGEVLGMEYVPGTADVKQGDLVVTSGIDKIYPKGFVIGTVEEVSRGTGTYHDITVRPAVDFSRLEEVLVVTTPPPAITAEQIAAEAAAIAAQQSAQNAAVNATPQNASPRNASPRSASPRNATPRNATPRAPRSRVPAAGNATPGNVPGQGPRE
jgi:rod shape-determining protein MreC